MEELEVGDYLVFKKDNEDGPDIKGGHSDALIIHATKIQKTSECEFYKLTKMEKSKGFLNNCLILNKF